MTSGWPVVADLVRYKIKNIFQSNGKPLFGPIIVYFNHVVFCVCFLHGVCLVVRVGIGVSVIVSITSQSAVEFSQCLSVS